MTTVIGPKQHPSNVVTSENVDDIFTYHSPTIEQARRYEMLREAARTLAREIFALCPACSDRTAAIRKLRECIMTANAAIALEIVQPPAEPDR